MHNFPDIVVANRRKIKKQLKTVGINPQVIKSICDSYRGRFVVVAQQDSNYMVVSHIPEYPELHLKKRGIAHSMTKRIRKGNPEHSTKLEIK